MKFFLPCFYAAMACLTFCIVFELHNVRHILSASAAGGVGWLVYLLLENHSSGIRFLLATIVVALLAELLARFYKAPATLFLIIGIIPLVPGGGMYYTMEALLNRDMPLFVERGLETATAAGAMAVGCSLVSSMARILTVWNRNRREEKTS